MCNVFAYMRISTKEERAKQKFNRQEKALNKYAEVNNMEYLLTFKEDKSGKNFTDRGEWQRLESIAHEGDTIVFKDITRFTREAENGYIKYMELMQRGINLIFIDNPTLNTDYTKQLIATAQSMNFLEKTVNEMLVKVLLAAELTRAEQERLTISKRTKDGLAASENRPGRKSGSTDKLTEEIRNDIITYIADRDVKAITIMKKHNICRNTLKKYVEIVKAEM